MGVCARVKGIRKCMLTGKWVCAETEALVLVKSAGCLVNQTHDKLCLLQQAVHVLHACTCRTVWVGDGLFLPASNA